MYYISYNLMWKKKYGKYFMVFFHFTEIYSYRKLQKITVFFYSEVHKNECSKNNLYMFVPLCTIS